MTDLLTSVRTFMRDEVLPREDAYYAEMESASNPHHHPLVLEQLKTRALDMGLWNLFLPHLDPDAPGTGLTNTEYAPIAEELGRVAFASEALNSSAPDTGNMELLHLFGTEEHRRRWLAPLLQGEIRSGFAMTEPDVASSDATNIALRIEDDGDSWTLRGRKWFTTGAVTPRCKVLIVMGVTDPDAPPHGRHSMVVVPVDTPGVEIRRSLRVYGYEDRGGHGDITFDGARVPKSDLLGERGAGFAMAQARLGPGRIHHCMRTIGAAERALDLLCERSLERVTFGTRLADQSLIQDWIGDARVQIDMARQYVLHAAARMDANGAKGAANEIAGIKVAIPRIALDVIDRAVQVHGAAGVSQDFPLAYLWTLVRTIRIADGPDEVHKRSIARRELRRHEQNRT